MLGFTSCCQISQDIPVLLSQRGDNGQNPFGKAETTLTLRAKRAFAPHHTPAQSTFSGVVGRFNTRCIDEGPQGWRDLPDIATSTGRLGMVNKSTELQPVVNFLSNRRHSHLKIGVGQSAISNTIPEGKHLRGLLQQGLTNHGRFAFSFDKSLEITQQMSPTQLPSRRIQPIVSRKAVRTDNGGNLLTQQLFGSSSAAAGHNEKNGHQRCGGCPQPLLFIVLGPTGFVNIDLLLLLHMGLGFGYWLGQNSTHLCFLVRHSTQPHLYLKDGGQYFAHIPTTNRIVADQQASDRLDTGAKAACRHAKRRLGSGFMTTVQAGKRMHLVFNNFRDYRGQLTDLVALRTGVFSQQQRTARFTASGLADHKTIDFIRWFQATAPANMPWLSPLLTLAFLFGWRFFHIRWVARWWLGRITRVLTHLLFQLSDTSLQLRHGFLQFIDGRQQCVDQGLHTMGRGIPILGRNAGWRLSISHWLIMSLFFRFAYPHFGGLTPVLLPN
jgi:hypothetical protein